MYSTQRANGQSAPGYTVSIKLDRLPSQLKASRPAFKRQYQVCNRQRVRSLLASYRSLPGAHRIQRGSPTKWAVESSAGHHKTDIPSNHIVASSGLAKDKLWTGQTYKVSISLTALPDMERFAVANVKMGRERVAPVFQDDSGYCSGSLSIGTPSSGVSISPVSSASSANSRASSSVVPMDSSTSDYPMSVPDGRLGYITVTSLKRIYSQRVKAIQDMVDMPFGNLFQLANKETKLFYSRPYYAYNRLTERSQYLRNVGGSSMTDDDVFQRYNKTVYPKAEKIKGAAVYAGLGQGREEAQSRFIGLGLSRKCLEEFKLGSCIDKAEAMIVDFFYKTPAEVIPLVGVISFYQTPKSYQQRHRTQKSGEYVEGYNNHAVVCVQSACTYAQLLIGKSLRPETLGEYLKSVDDICVPKALQEKKTVLCDASTGIVSRFECDAHWHNHMYDTEDFLSSSNPGVKEVDFSSLYRVDIEWFPLFTMESL